MFTAARLKLTAWYLLIIMAVSLLFSVVIYTGTDRELRHFERLSVVRREVDFFGTRIQREPAFNPEEIADLRKRLILTLALVNLGILAFSGIFGYLLAGKTLRPIEIMVVEQKRFIADASHELRTPLTAMKTEIEVALRDKDINLPQTKQLLKSNLEETNKMQSLSNYLLSLSRYQNDGANFPLEKVNTGKLMQSTLDKLTPLAKKKDIKIETHLKELETTANPDALTELFTILIDNAIKYSPEKSKIIVKVQKSRSHTEVIVQDFGIGIKASDIPHIFDRFYRADTSRSKTQSEGYGLGLSIAKSIVILHHGKIEAQSTPNSGSIFTVSI